MEGNDKWQAENAKRLSIESAINELKGVQTAKAEEQVKNERLRIEQEKSRQA